VLGCRAEALLRCWGARGAQPPLSRDGLGRCWCRRASPGRKRAASCRAWPCSADV